MSTSGRSIVQGAAVLTASTIIVKVIGALFKIPLANILGGVGMSYFVSAYDIFVPLYSMAVTGLGVSVSRAVSESGGIGEEKIRILHTARMLFFLVGLAGWGLLTLLSGPLTAVIGNPGARTAVCVIAPSLLFSCVTAAYRGYFQGQSNMRPTAESQVLEAVVKLVVGIAAAFFIYRKLSFCYGEGTAPAFLQALPGQQAGLKIMMLSAAGAVLGVTASTFAGMLFMTKTRRRKSARGKYHFSISLAKELMRIALPIAATSAVANLTTIIDLSSVMNCLSRAVRGNTTAILQQYAGLFPPEVTIDVIPEYLYGCYSGLTVSIFNLVPALTAGIGISAIPVIAAQLGKNRKNEAERAVRSALLTVAIIAFPVGIGITALPEQILMFLYPFQSMEVTIVVPILRVMGISTVLVAFSAVMNNVLQALGKEKKPLFAILIGGLLKLITNYILVSRVEVNIHGVAYGTLFCYLFIFLFDAAALIKCGFPLRSFAVLIKPLVGGILCGITAKTGYNILIRYLGNTLSLLIAAFLGAISYFAVLFLIRCIKTNEIYDTFYKRKNRK